VPVGRYDTKYLLEQGYEKEIRAFNHSMFCNCEQAVKNSLKNDQAIIIVDIEGLRYSRVAHFQNKQNTAQTFSNYTLFKLIPNAFVGMQLTHEFFQNMEQNFPEMTQQIIVINGK